MKQLGIILLLISVGIFLAVKWAGATERARAAEAYAEEITETAEQAAEDYAATEEVFREALDSVASASRARLDSITALPPEVPALDPELLVLLDTAALNEAVAVAVTMVREDNDALRVENQGLRVRLSQARVTADSAMVAQARLYDARLALADQVNLNLADALEAQAEATQQWKNAATLSFTEKVVYGLVGGGIALTVNSITN